MKDRRHKQRRALAAHRRYRSTLAGGLQIEPLESRFVLDAVVVFNELNYHPADSTPNLEWVELHNQQSVDVDMSGWSIGGGINYTFAEGTRTSADVAIWSSPSRRPSCKLRPVAGVLGPYTGALNNSGEKLTLLDNNQREMDEMEYSDDGDWPVADGSGASLAKRKARSGQRAGRELGNHTQTGGTPGSINFPDGVRAAVQTTLLPLTASWQYNQAGVNLAERPGGRQPTTIVRGRRAQALFTPNRMTRPAVQSA